MSRTINSLGVEAPGRMGSFSYEEGPLGDGWFALETLHTGLSAGTELTFHKGTNPYLTARWDEPFGAFDESQPGASYPIPFLGYMEVGRVVESKTSAVREGAVVGMAYGHKTGHQADPLAEPFAVLPPDLDPVLGIYVAQMGPICVNGLLHAAHEQVGPNVRALSDGVEGRRLAVVGAGVVGLLTALLASWHGAAEVLVAENSPQRRVVAEALGFETVAEGELWDVAKSRWSHGPNDRGADTVFQCRASSAALHDSLRALRPQGAVIDLAFYQGGSPDLKLGEAFHHNGLSIRCAQIGRVPRGTAHAWDRARLMRETMDLLRSNQDAILKHMITHRVPYDEAPGFVDALVRDRPDFVQVVFDL